jgi:hypothetical protein
MNRRTMIAALTAIGAVTFAAAPGQAQQSALEAQISTEAPAPRAGARPMPRMEREQKGAVEGKALIAQGGNVGKLQMAPSVDVPIENK